MPKYPPYLPAMFIIHVFLQVKKDCIHQFKEITLDNARNTLREPGAVRFDVVQDQDDSSRFIFVEVYKSASDLDHHKTTEHYARWAGAVDEFLVEPRSRVLLENVFPDDAGWTSPEV
ncbi:MAG: antibiotic biosynthesis monooxygenase [Opitutae bacterium]|nr:antibiotic biosynthesis monooxygenase [Opitutae bacterium]